MLTPGDLDAVVAYHPERVPAIRNEVQPPVYKVAMPAAARARAPRSRSTDDELNDPVKQRLLSRDARALHGVPFAQVGGRAAGLQEPWGKGGHVFKGPFGESTAANISSHKEKGIGGWTDAEIKRALTEGRRRTDGGSSRR